MPIQRTVNQDFFKKWTPEMAYVLGFFAADGNMIRNNRGAHFIAFYSNDLVMIENIKKLLSSNHKVGVKTNKQTDKCSYQIQIGSKKIFKDLIKLGLVPNKSLVLQMPQVPENLLSHFVRGYFDGDGHVSVCRYQKSGRKTKSNVISTGFTSGSKIFLEMLLSRLKRSGITTGGSLFLTDGYHLCFSIKDSLSLSKFMYKDSKDLYLARKKSRFDHYFSNLLGV